MPTIRIAHPTGASTATHKFEADEPVEMDYEAGLALSRIKDAGFYVVDVINPDPEPEPKPVPKDDEVDPDRLDEIAEVGDEVEISEHGDADEVHEEPAPAKTARRSGASKGA